MSDLWSATKMYVCLYLKDTEVDRMKYDDIYVTHTSGKSGSRQQIDNLRKAANSLPKRDDCKTMLFTDI